MKVILFCGGLGTRIRDYSETIPKPMVPVGSQPILWHVMKYYQNFGHNDFILCLGYKSSTIKEYFLKYDPTMYRDFFISHPERRVEVLGESDGSWRVTLVDTGLLRNIGSRLTAVRHLLEGEEVFFANYSDGLTDVDLDAMTRFFLDSGKIGCFLAVQPNFSYHLVDFDDLGSVRGFQTSYDTDIWINGGYFIFRRAIFDYMRDGEELVVEPFHRLIEENQLVAYRHSGFWASMDTLKDKQILDNMVERGETLWLNGKTLA